MGRNQSLLTDKVVAVGRMKDLTDSAACVGVGDNEMGEERRNIMAAAGQGVPEYKSILRINMAHPLVAKLESEEDAESAGRLARVLFDQAALSAGRPLENPAEFVQELNRLMFG